MPAIEHGDFTLYETQAIVRYIDRVWPQPALTPRIHGPRRTWTRP